MYDAGSIFAHGFTGWAGNLQAAGMKASEHYSNPVYLPQISGHGYSMPRDTNSKPGYLYDAALVTIFIISARYAFIDSTDVYVYAWTAFWCIGFAGFINGFRTLLLLIAFVIFFQQSTWYVFGDMRLMTIYEREVFYFKPVELLVFSAFLKGLITNPDYKFNKHIAALSLFWLIVIASGILTSLLNGVPVYDIFIFSEFRTLLSGLLLMTAIVKLVEPEKIHRLLLWFLVLALVRTAFSFIEYFFDIVLLWSSVSINYGATSVHALLGGDPDVAVLLFAFSYCLMWLVFNPAELKTRLNNTGLTTLRNLMLCLAVLLIISIFFSLRRGGVISLFLIILGAIFFGGSKQKATILLLVVSVAFVIAGYFSVSSTMSVLIDRFAGHGIHVQMSNRGHWLDIYDAWEALKGNFLFGLGPGTRLELQRFQLYGIYENHILVHQAVLHTWIKYGLMGVIAYFATYLGAIRRALIMLRNYRSVMSDRNKVVMASMFLYLCAMMVWGQVSTVFYQNFRKTALLVLALSLIYNLSFYEKQKHIAASATR